MANTAAKLSKSFLHLQDGAQLHYYSVGQGPGLIIIHGAMGSALTHIELALALSDKYTIYLPSRRCRGLSGPYADSIMDISNPLVPPATGPERDSLSPTYKPDFCASVLETDISDVVALVKHTSSIFALGVSSGAAILLETCVASARYPEFAAIQKVILFEPPLIFTNSPRTGPEAMDVEAVRRYEEERNKGDVTSALVTGMLIAQLGPSWLRALPRFVIRFLTSLLLSGEERNSYKAVEVPLVSNDADQETGATSMADLAPMLRYDFAAVGGMIGPPAKFSKANSGQDIMLLGGTDSPGYLKRGLRVLGENMEGVQTAQIMGVGHEVLMNKDKGGDVAKAVSLIEDFLV